METGVRSEQLIGELREKYRRNMTARNLRPRTIQRYEEDVDRFFRYLEFRKVDFDKVNWEFLEDWVLHQRQEEAKVTTIAARLSAVSGLFRIACRYDVFRQNPRDLLDPMRKDEQLVEHFTEEETMTLLAGAKKPRDLAILEVLYATGCRADELRSMDLGDLRLDVPDVAIRKAKGRRERLDPLTPTAVGAIESWLPRRSEILKDRGREHETALFVSNYGLRLSYHRIYWTVRKLAAQLGISENARPHMIRHSIATHLLDRDADLRFIMELLGHARLESAQVYTHVAQKRIREVYKRCHPRA